MAIGEMRTHTLNASSPSYRPPGARKELVMDIYASSSDETKAVMVTNGTHSIPVGGYYAQSRFLITNEWYLTTTWHGAVDVEVTTLEVL